MRRRPNITTIAKTINEHERLKVKWFHATFWEQKDVHHAKLGSRISDPCEKNDESFIWVKYCYGYYSKIWVMTHVNYIS